MQLFNQNLWIGTDDLEWRNSWYHKIVKSLKESSLLIKGVSETIKNEAKEQKGGFLGILIGTLAASLLVNMSAGKPKIRSRGVIRAGEAI